jgi:hypothetical protein
MPKRDRKYFNRRQENFAGPNYPVINETQAPQLRQDFSGKQPYSLNELSLILYFMFIRDFGKLCSGLESFFFFGGRKNA